jgi:Pvc16 N-terminal domain/Carboxypeptidase regulatory-like domain
MIRDLSLTLQALMDDPALAPDFPELFGAQIVFDRPAEGFNPTVPTIDLFLFDIRENVELRSNEPQVTRSNGQVSITRPPLRVSCSYLLTAWPVSGGDLALQEQRLLGQALQVLSRYPHIPGAFARGQLVGQAPPLPMMTAQSDGVREPYEFWSAIGNKMRASIIVTATIGIETLPPVVAPEVVTSQIHFGPRASADGSGLAATAGPPRFRIAGRVTNAASQPVVDAMVSVVEIGLTAKTDEEGRYQVGAMVAGTYTVRAQKDAAVTSVTVAVPRTAGITYDLQL